MRHVMAAIAQVCDAVSYIVGLHADRMGASMLRDTRLGENYHRVGMFTWSGKIGG